MVSKECERERRRREERGERDLNLNPQVMRVFLLLIIGVEYYNEYQVFYLLLS